MKSFQAVVKLALEPLAFSVILLFPEPLCIRVQFIKFRRKGQLLGIERKGKEGQASLGKTWPNPCHDFSLQILWLMTSLHPIAEPKYKIRDLHCEIQMRVLIFLHHCDWSCVPWGKRNLPSLYLLFSPTFPTCDFFRKIFFSPPRPHVFGRSSLASPKASLAINAHRGNKKQIHAPITEKGTFQLFLGGGVVPHSDQEPLGVLSLFFESPREPSTTSLFQEGKWLKPGKLCKGCAWREKCSREEETCVKHTIPVQPMGRQGVCAC